MNRDSYVSRMSIGPSYGYRPDRPLFSRGNERSIITSVYNRIALDVSSMTVQHVRLDGSDRFKEVIESGLNNCLTVEANVDQTGRAFMQDIVMSMLDEGDITVKHLREMKRLVQDKGLRVPIRIDFGGLAPNWWEATKMDVITK